MVRPIIVDADPLLYFPFSWMRTLTANTALLAFVFILLVGQYANLVNYRTGHCNPDDCVYMGSNTTQCERCKDNYLDQHVIYYRTPEGRKSEVYFFGLYSYVHAFSMLSLAVGLYFFNFFFLGAYFGFQAARFLSFLFKLATVGSDIGTFLFKSREGYMIWTAVYLMEIVWTTSAVALWNKFRELRQKGDC